MSRFTAWVRLLALVTFVYVLWFLIFDTSRIGKHIDIQKYMKADHTRFEQFCLSRSNEDVLGEINSNTRQIRQSETRHLVFLKVHKAASSTVQNIFMRFGAVRDLVFALPKRNTNVISVTGTVSEQNVLRPPSGRKYDILCCHVIYNKAAMQTFMPKDTVYVGIIRHPFGQFLSTIKYFYPKDFFNIQGLNKMKTFLQNPTKYIPRSAAGHFLNNRMAYEFNFPRTLFINRNEDDIQTYLRQLDQEFSIVLVVDHLDESLIMMRRLLGWKLKDIIHGHINDGKHLFTKVPKIKTATELLHKRWAELDYALYDYFNKRLFEKIKSEGPDFEKELLYFKKVQRDVQSFCYKTYHTHVKDSLVMDPSPWNDRFEITSLDCIYMNIGEEVFIQEIRHRQYTQD